MSYRALVTLVLPTFNEKLDFCVRLTDDLAGGQELVDFLHGHTIKEGIDYINGEFGTKYGIAKLEFAAEKHREEWADQWADQRWTVDYKPHGTFVKTHGDTPQHTPTLATLIDDVAGMSEVEEFWADHANH